MGFEHEISDLAYELYVNSGFIEGRDIQNWLEAERIVLARHRLQVEVPVEPTKKRVMRSKGKKDKKNESDIA
jgi:Protein of unknown function (DUF2934)